MYIYKSKAISVTDRGVLYGCEILRIPHCLDNPPTRMASSGMLRSVALVRTDVSEELSASFIRVSRISELGTTLAVTSNRRTLLRNTIPHSHCRENLKPYNPLTDGREVFRFKYRPHSTTQQFLLLLTFICESLEPATFRLAA
jgi:hypothetical protein